MKLTIRLSVLFLFIHFSLPAQTGFRFGPSVAYIASKPKVVDSIPNNYFIRFKSGFNLGVMAYYGFSDKIGVTVNALYTSKGYRLFNDSLNKSVELKQNQSLIEFPINFVLKQRLNSVSNIRENIGFTLSNLMSATQREIRSENGNFRIKEETKSTFYTMLNIGLEVSHEAKNNNVFVFGAFIRQGLGNNTNLGIYSNSKNTKPLFNLGYKGSYIGISVSYLFNLTNLKKQEEFFY
ncbi:MAG: hypothetical protein PSX81_16135 [bacterium]|nr:hypothetical protein [bacterium]